MADRTVNASSWAVADGLRWVGTRLRDGIGALPKGTFVRWISTLAAGFAACAVLVIGLTWIARDVLGDRLQAWDDRAIRSIEHGPMNFQQAILLESPGNLSYLIPVTVGAMLLGLYVRRPIVALSFPAAYVLMRPLVILGWSMWDRARPDVIAEGIAAPGLHSFPSGHAALCVATYGLATYLWIRRSRSLTEQILAALLCLIWVSLVSLARVRLGTHWPSDIIAGGIIGAAWLTVVIVALNRAEQKVGQETPMTTSH